MFKETAIFFFKSAIALVAAVFAVRQAVSGPIWIFALVVPLLALPSVLLSGVFLALQKGNNLITLSEKGWMRSLVSGAFLRMAVLSVVSMVLSILALVRLAVAETAELLTVISGVVLFWPLFVVVRSQLGAQWALPFRHVYPVIWARWLAVAAVVVIGFLIMVFEPYSQTTLNLNLPNAQSGLMRELLGFSHIATQVQIYGLERIAENGTWWRIGVLTLAALGQISTAWVLISIVAIFSVPAVEFRRVIARASTAVEAPRLSSENVTWTSALTTLFLLFVWLPQVAAVDTWFAGRAQVYYAEKATQKVKKLLEVERIGKGKYRIGTTGKITAVQQNYTMATNEIRSQLVAAINAGSDKMVQNVDPFLDGYYSLWGEYTRVLAMLNGDLEKEIGDKLNEALKVNDPFAEYNDLVEQVLPSEKSRTEELRKQITEILDKGRISPEELAGSDVRVVASSPSLLEGFALTFQELDYRMQQRTQASSAGAVVTSVVVAVVVKKVAAKGTIKLAAKAVTKIAASKIAGGSGGAIAGAAAGAAVGSFVPGLGTAVGAAVGGALGAVAGGVAIDKIFLLLEEEFQREAFHSEIVEGINYQRAAMIAKVNDAY